MDIPSFAKILDPQVSVRGAKYALISMNKLHGDNKLKLTIGDKIIPTSTPFGVSCFNNDDATALGLLQVTKTTDRERIFHSSPFIHILQIGNVSFTQVHLFIYSHRKIPKLFL